jgi:hypothetical protein
MDRVPAIPVADIEMIESIGNALDSPLLIFVASLLAQLAAAYAGEFIRKKARPISAENRGSFDVIRTAALTLLGLIIAFSFSMAVSRYDQRKNYEEAEANAIGTEYLRADYLPGDDGAELRDLLTKYVGERILFYVDRDEIQIGHVDEDTAKLQAALWSIVTRTTKEQQTAVMSLVVSGMNDVLNSQGYTQAGWWNRIPVAAWMLMGLIAISCNLMLGYGEHRMGSLKIVLPIILSISFFLVADIDNPRRGLIRVPPHNLFTLYKSIGGH